MAPSRNSRSVNRRIPFANEVSPEKVEGETTKNWQRKRKLSDTLGPQWSKEELERFYEAYRKFGKDWKKVAASIRSRSAEMVEALFSMNRAYLSLPEGTASVVGLTAMMTDHYAMMARSDSDQESSDGAVASKTSRSHAKLPQRNSRKTESKLSELPRSNTDLLNYGCLSLLKKRRSGIKTPVVGKRTPRIPVSYSYDRDFGVKLFSPNQQGLKQKMNAGDDYDSAHEVAVALTVASQRGGSPNLSQNPTRKSAKTETSSVRIVNGMHTGSESTSTKPHDSEFEDVGELSLRSSEGTGTGVLRKEKKYSKVLKIKENPHYDDIKEACSGTEEGEEAKIFKKKLKSRVASAKSAKSPSKGLKRKGKKVLFGEDRDSTFDALQTLADLSLMMPASTDDSNLNMQIKEEIEKVDSVKQSELKDSFLVPTEVNPQRTSEAKKAVGCETNSVEELKEKVQSNAGKQKRKRRSSPFRISKADESLDSHRTDSKKIQASKRKGQCSPQNTSQTKQDKMQKPAERTASSTDLKMEVNELLSTSLMNFTKGKSKSNRGAKKNIRSDKKFLGSTKQDKPKIPIPWFNDASHNPKEKLQHFLSRSRARKWCIFEWFYSAIDYPWFATREFAEYLDHVGLGHVPCLTQVEWGVIRSSLGRPRRFSKQFLKEEKEKLLQHRESVRRYHSSFRAGNLEVLPSDVPIPISEGQHIIVIHPVSREIHGGYVLTVDHSSCLVQFEQLELGIHWVKDIDCMPLNPLDNFPESLARAIQISKKLKDNNGFLLSEQMKELVQFLELPTAKIPVKADDLSHPLPSSNHIIKTLNLPEGGSSDCNSRSTIEFSRSENATRPRARNSLSSDGEQIQAREADIQALSELTHALDKKEAVLLELRRMNDQVSELQKDGLNSLKDSEPFKRQYAATLLWLNDLNQQVSSALYCLRQRNSYQENGHPECGTASVHPTIQLSSIGLSTCKPADSRPLVDHIIESSRMKARAMVFAAMQATSSLFKEAKNLDGFEEALDYVSSKLSAQDFLPSSDSNLVNMELQCLGTSNLKSINSVGVNDEKIPLELIANCIATLLMIQEANDRWAIISSIYDYIHPGVRLVQMDSLKLMNNYLRNCTRREFPPADIAQIIDSAIKSLRPLCSQNLPIYTEIQNCMGMIRNQILGLVPTT